jgi:hypothetical protein
MGSDRSRTRPGVVGLRYVFLFVCGTAAALVVAHLFDLGVAATSVSVLLGLGPLYLGWAAFRHDRAEAGDALTLQSTAAALAEEVRRQWVSEAEIRRLNDPYPLPVAWRSADADLVEDWSLLRSTARAWPGGPPADPAHWPAAPAGLAGRDGQIGDIFTLRTPTRRLVILGEPGAGKTMLLLRLLLDLIERRSADNPVPVLFTLASWNPSLRTLPQWMADQLGQSYPWLLAAAPTGPATGPGQTLAQSLLDGQWILPILDGFDELPPALRTVALDAVNRYLPLKQPVVLASRAAEYRAALSQPGTAMRLNGAAGIELLPLPPEESATYLRRSAGQPLTGSGGRWQPVVDQLGTSSPLGQALGTPLGLFLARTVYSRRPGPGTGPPPDPAELCVADRFPGRQDIDRHLLGGFVHASYGPDEPQAHRVLALLAGYLESRRGGSPDIAWWELRNLLPARRIARSIAAGLAGAVFLACTLATFLTASFSLGFWGDLLYCVTEGIFFGLLTGLTIAGSGRLLVAPVCILAALLHQSSVTSVTPADLWSLFRDPGLWSLCQAFAVGASIWLGYPALAWTATRFRHAGPVRSLALGLTGAVIGASVTGALQYAGFAAEPPASISPVQLFGYALQDGTLQGLFLGLAYAARIGLRTPWASPGGQLVWRWYWPGFLGALLLGGTVTLLAMVSGQAVQPFDSPYSAWSASALAGAAVALVVGPAGALGFGLAVQSPDLATAVGPGAVLARDRAASTAMALSMGGIFTLIFGLSSALVHATTGDDAFSALSFGLQCGLIGAVLGGLHHTSFVSFAVAQRHLRRRCGFPPDVMAFLEDAHLRKGVLRQVGPVYQFRHIDLQRYLAQHPPPISP